MPDLPCTAVGGENIISADENDRERILFPVAEGSVVNCLVFVEFSTFSDSIEGEFLSIDKNQFIN